MATSPQGTPETILIFFEMVSPLLLYPVLVVSTLASIIASQALISGAFSLAEQAVQLGYLPRLTIVNTSGEVAGQIYVPLVNWALLVACVLLVVIFKSSSNLAAAYGVAVIGTMLITTLLLAEVTHVCWGWPWAASATLLALLLMVDVPFFAANLVKVVTGGWIPLLVGALLFIEIRDYGQEFFGVTARHGFLEVPQMPRFLELCKRKGLDLDPQHVMFFISRMTVVPTGTTALVTWRKRLFAFLYLNARPVTSYYQLPPDHVVELGRLIEL